ncbi:MAG TPA: N-acetylmuramoyl-L-alanine amidase [Candidatus Limnocylindria bacterium]|nr:N-acetylmuramoyl-L-alanine amidase [Candidatus Limnocylindria bacterium]
MRRENARGEAGILTRALAGLVALVAAGVAAVLVLNSAGAGVAVTRFVAQAADPNYVPAGAPLGMIGSDPDDPTDPWSAAAPPGGAIVQMPGPTASPSATGTIRIPVPRTIPTGPRRVGIQVGHWKTDEAPDELRRLIPQTGAAWEGLTEVDVNLDVAQRLAVILGGKGIAVDILPVTVPPGYIADAVVAIHADSDGVGQWSGFKMAHSARRGPYEDALLAAIKKAYGDATGMEYDATHISNAMKGYYFFNWSRYQHSVSPYTPSVILELGYLSSDDDRALMLDHPDKLAGGIADGILKFLSDTPRSKIFGQELVVPAFPSRPTRTSVP